MFVRVKPIPKNGRRSVQICESQRVGKTVKQRIIRHVGVAVDDSEEKALRELGEVIIAKMEMEQSASLSLFSPEEVAATTVRTRRKASPLVEVEAKLADVVEEKRVVEGIGDIFGTLYDELGFNKVVGSRYEGALKATVLARITDPSSKRRTTDLLARDFDFDVSLDRIYRMMDAVHKRSAELQDVVRSTTLNLLENKLDVCFFDVTTLYFESVTEDTLRGFGYSKDQKFHSVQVVLALATTRDGLPVGYKLFPGKTAEIATLIACVTEWREKADIGKVTFVADRGMMSDTNLKALEEANFFYVVGTSLKKLDASIRSWALAPGGYNIGASDNQCVWVKDCLLKNGRRLIASYSSRRAKKDASDRLKLIDALKKKIGNTGKTPTKKLISNRGYVKYTKTEGVETAAIDEGKVAEDSGWDGMYGLMTNLVDTSPFELLARYKQLWTIEDAFRVNKSDLRMRPIFHWKPERIQAHVAICFLSYALAKQVQWRLRQKGIILSIDILRSELQRVQASILRDTTTGKRVRLPSQLSPVAQQIYGAFRRTRSASPTPA